MLTFAAMVVLALLGHGALWVGLVNRWHAVGFPRPVVKSITQLFYGAFYAIPLLIVWRVAQHWTSWKSPPELGPWSQAYIAFCAVWGLLTVPVWLARRSRWRRLPGGVSRGDDYVVDLVRHLGSSLARGPRASLMARIPFNQLCHLHVAEFSVHVPSLARELDGLSICHWSDLHLSGRIDRGYYEEVVRQTNSLQCDILALTGDICDTAATIDWLPAMLAPVEAPMGKFFILGNHDLRTHDVGRLRATMQSAGFVDLGGRCRSILEGRILVAGDERPWFRQVPELEPNGGGVAGTEPYKILLAHTPDQFAWARANGFDLMLAGHTHGGQIQFPLIGPVVCPSWHGTKYAAGFFGEPPTLLHVSRGTASLFPLRILCRPEITKLVLRATKAPA